MTESSVSRKVSDVAGDMETNKDAMRVICDIGLDICSSWATYDTVEQNLRMNEQMFVLFHTLQANLKTYDTLVMESMAVARGQA